MDVRSSAELWARLHSGDTPRSWYCVRTHPKHEHIAAARLRELPQVEVYNPQLRLRRHTRQGEFWVTESLFPNYLFARFALSVLLDQVRHTPSVKCVLRFGDRVPSVPDPVIADLRLALEQTPLTYTDAPLAGDEVEVGRGPFMGAKGEVIRVMPARHRVQILLEVMGRSVAAELSLDQLVYRKKPVSECVLGHAEMSRRVVARALGQTRSGPT